MGLRSSLAVAGARSTSFLLKRVLKRNASQLPGRVALAIDPHVLSSLANKIGSGSIVVCGTNGKTTTTNLMAAAVSASGKQVLCNTAGANMLAGVTAALVPGRSCDWAVLEADELSTIRILPELKPTYLVLLNLFRDQLDRAGEIDHVQDVIVSALAASPATTLVTCGDDPLCMGVALRAQAAGTRVLTFGIAEKLDTAPDRVPEARFCQKCGAELEYSYRHYAQLGAFSCPACDFARPALDWQATRVHVDEHGVSFELAGPRLAAPTPVKADFGGTYMVYNLMAACIGALLAGADAREFQTALDSYKPANGRLQRFDVAGREVILNLAKNPTGLNQNISLMLADGRKKSAFIVVNDDYNDGKDISWIWDVDFERLAADKDIRLVAGGHRANDVQVRLKYAGLPARIALSVSEALEEVRGTDASEPLYVLCNYSALWPAKAELESIGARK
jgi:UDP-N-acetylmuramyl tripeptide synthase